MSSRNPQMAADLYRTQQHMFRAYSLPMLEAVRQVLEPQATTAGQTLAPQGLASRSSAKAVETQDARAVQAAAEADHTELADHPEEASQLRLYNVTRNPPAATVGRFVNAYA